MTSHSIKAANASNFHLQKLNKSSDFFSECFNAKKLNIDTNISSTESTAEDIMAIEPLKIQTITFIITKNIAVIVDTTVAFLSKFINQIY
jgi:hypothetical protein